MRQLALAVLSLVLVGASAAHAQMATGSTGSTSSSGTMSSSGTTSSLGSSTAGSTSGVGSSTTTGRSVPSTPGVARDLTDPLNPLDPQTAY